jgi:hypothetical protein
MVARKSWQPLSGRLPVIRLVLVSPGQLALKTLSLGLNRLDASCG